MAKQTQNGKGRPRLPKRKVDAIRRRLHLLEKPADISTKLGVSLGAVYTIRREMDAKMEGNQ